MRSRKSKNKVPRREKKEANPQNSPQSSVQPRSCFWTPAFYLRSLGGLFFQLGFVLISEDSGQGSRRGRYCHRWHMLKQSGTTQTGSNKPSRPKNCDERGEATSWLLSKPNACSWKPTGKPEDWGPRGTCSRPPGLTRPPEGPSPREHGWSVRTHRA